MQSNANTVHDYTCEVANSEHNGLVFVKQKFSRSDRGFRRRHQRLSTTSSEGVHQGSLLRVYLLLLVLVNYTHMTLQVLTYFIILYHAYIRLIFNLECKTTEKNC